VNSVPSGKRPESHSTAERSARPCRLGTEQIEREGDDAWVDGLSGLSLLGRGGLRLDPTQRQDLAGQAVFGDLDPVLTQVVDRPALGILDDDVEDDDLRPCAKARRRRRRCGSDGLLRGCGRQRRNGDDQRPGGHEPRQRVAQGCSPMPKAAPVCT
jgi:hypothetical protein